MAAPTLAAGVAGAALGAGGGALGVLITGVAEVGVGAAGVGVLGGGVFGACCGAGGGASDNSSASTVFSVIRTTWRASPELMAHNNSACSAMTKPMLVKCCLGARWRCA